MIHQNCSPSSLILVSLPLSWTHYYHQLVYRACTSQGIQLHPKFHHHHHHNKDKRICTKFVLLNMTKLQQNSSNNILSIRSEHYALPATITLKPITHLLVLMLIGGNIGEGGEQGKRECFCYFFFYHQFHIIGLGPDRQLFP